MDNTTLRQSNLTLDQKIRINRNYPYYEALKVAVLYGIIGIIWIGFPDELLLRFPQNIIQLKMITIYKGWSYVALTVILLFRTVLKKHLLFKESILQMDINLKKQKEIEKELHKLAYYDTLTGLPNRFMFEEKCKRLIYTKNNQSFAFVYMDVDNFKGINDTLGHLAGDKFLIHISQILLKSIGNDAFAARMGGDEFAIIFRGVSTKEEVTNIMQDLLKNLRVPWKYDNQEFFISASMGIVIYPTQANTLSLLLRYSDIAMYEVKKDMKNGFCFYSDNLLDRSLKQITMANELRKALANNEFTLHYQPIVDLESSKLIGVEALIRWVHPEKGVISPAEFIPVAEEDGLIHDIGRWVMRTAFIQKKEWEELGYPHLKMSINVSGKSLVQNGFVNEIRDLLRRTNLNSQEIQLEITETVLIEKMAASTKVLEEISKMGIKIALDDFGTGYSSLTYLKNLPIDVVKLDAHFIKGILENGEDSVIVESVIKLTHDLKLQMVAEGIETKEQLSLLQSNDCDFGQGYLFSRPVSWYDIEQLMEQQAS